MNNFEEYYNKNCIFVVGFSSDTVGGGSSPSYLYGKLLEVNDDFVVVDITNTYGGGFVIKNLKNKNLLGKTFVNKKYVIAINPAE